MVSIRGAITVENNKENDILIATKKLIKTIEEKNNLLQDQVISMIFSTTDDLNKVAPSKAARNLGYTNISLMNFNEIKVENGLGKCIRVMILCNLNKRQSEVNHIYLKNAKILRPDLIEE